MAYAPLSNYHTEVRQGNFPGRSKVSIRGHDDSVPNGGPFDLSPEFGAASYVFDQSAIDATPAVVSVASTDNTADAAAGTGALTVRVSGLNSSGVPATEDVTMTGQTAAATTATFSAVFELLVLTTGSGNANAGTIWCGTGTFTVGVPAVRMLSMEAGYNKSLSAYYVVPAGNTLYLQRMVATVAGTTKDAEISIRSGPDGALWYTEVLFGLGAGGLAADVLSLPGLVAGTHIKVTAKGAAAGTEVAVIIGAELIVD